ncbi:MAG: isoprenylcysteine carboxylmethyltransferase family protein [Pseudomonadota bacterium]
MDTPIAIAGVAFGLPQILAVLLIVQRVGEEIYSQANTRALIAKGAHEEGADYYPVVAAAHLGWIAAIALLIPADAAAWWAVLGLFMVVQVARYVTLATIGPYWTHRIITLPGAPVVRRGVYAWVRHPNYLITRLETFLVPMIFGEVALALIFSAIWWCVLEYKIKLEDAALAPREQPSDVAHATAAASS